VLQIGLFDRSQTSLGAVHRRTYRPKRTIRMP
jgi:hypothetical protein